MHSRMETFELQNPWDHLNFRLKIQNLSSQIEILMARLKVHSGQSTQSGQSSNSEKQESSDSESN